MIKKAISQNKVSGSGASKSSNKPKTDVKSKTGDKNSAKTQESAKPAAPKEKGKTIEELGGNELSSLFLYFCIRGDKRRL